MGRMANNQTKVTQAKPETVSVRTTIPSHIAEKLNLLAGDILDWDVDRTAGGTWVAVIAKRDQA